MQVTKSEKRLLVVLAVIIFGMGNFFGYRWLTQKETALRLSSLQLESDQAQARVDLQDTDKYKQRKAWIDAHEPEMTDEGDAKAAVLDYAVKGAHTNKLDVLDQNLGDVQHGPGGARVNVTVKVKGSMQDLVKWLGDFQKPEEFYALSLFSLKADQDQKSMVCTLRIARYFKEKAGS
jgi:hypothetical protein